MKQQDAAHRGGAGVGSKEILPEHLERLQRESGLLPDTIRAAGLWSATRADVARLLGFDPSSGGIAFPYPGADGFCRIRLDKPYRAPGWDKPAKYLTPPGAGNRLYIPPNLPPGTLEGTGPLIITEGEKKALKACQDGIPCVATSGVWSWKQRGPNGEKLPDHQGLLPDFGKLRLKGREVVVLVYDSDITSEHPAWAAYYRLARELKRRGVRQVKVVTLPALPEVRGKVGLDDFLLHRTPTDFWQLVAAAPEWECEKARSPEEEQALIREPVVKRLADVEPEEVSWLWEPYLPCGKITLLEGDPGVGKSWLALALAAIVSRGWPFPGPDGIPPGEQVREPGNVLYLSAEDGLADTIRVRLDSAGADAARVYVLTGWTAQTESGDRLDGYVTLQDIPLLEEALARICPTLLVVDPVQGFLGGIDAWRAEQVRPILARIGELAARYGCAVLLIRHLSKSPKDRAIYRGLGSIDFSAAARSVLAVVRKDDERGIVHVKSSLAPEGPSIGFDIRDGLFVWTGLSKLTKADVNAPEAPPEDRTQAEECADFLRDLLADGPRPAQEVIRLAARAGYRGGTLDRGKALAGVKAQSKRGPGGRLEGWEWFLSPGHQPPLHQGSTPPPIPGGALVSGAANPSAATIPPDNHQSTNMVLWGKSGETVGRQGFRGQSTRAPENIGGPPDALDGVVEEGVIE
jgi:hypothetical protein